MKPELPWIKHLPIVLLRLYIGPQKDQDGPLMKCCNGLSYLRRDIDLLTMETRDQCFKNHVLGALLPSAFSEVTRPPHPDPFT